MIACRCSCLFSTFQHIQDRFGNGGNDGRIDVNALMVSLGLRLPESEAEKHETAYKELARQASRLPVNTNPAPDFAPASAPPIGSDDQDRLLKSRFVSNSCAYSDPRSKAPTSDAFLGETPSGRDGQHGRELNASRADQADETDVGDDRSSRQRSAGGEPDDIEEGYVRLDRRVADPKDSLDPMVEDSTFPVNFAHATAGREPDARERGDSIGEGTNPSGKSSKITPEQENARFVRHTSLT